MMEVRDRGGGWDESTLSAQAMEQGGSPDEYYLVVVESDSSLMVPLPTHGEVIIGRGTEVPVRLRDMSVSRRHAMLVVGAGEVRLTDLGSHNGTLVNGERVVGSRPLVSGDVIQICSVTLVLHARIVTRGHTVLEHDLLRQRAAGELERSLRYRRPLGLVAVSLHGHTDRPRIDHAIVGVIRSMDVVGWATPDCAIVLLPEVEPSSVPEVARKIRDVVVAISREARVGFASCPGDGVDVDTLLASARAAATSGAAGEVCAAAQAYQVLRVGSSELVVADPAMLRLYELIKRLAVADLPVLVWGETGSGKELAASAIHHWSSRRDGPLVVLNSAALPESLVESELFGHERGAFTGASASRVGLLEQASGGTMFLDEIGELSLGVQVKLLRVLETKTVTRIGDTRARPIDIRIVAATNRNLADEVTAGRFRQDLFFRLAGATLWLPPLRDRRRELPILAQTFLADACQRANRPPMAIASEAMQRLLSHAWPGNVRELRNVMDYVVAAHPESTLEAWHLADRIAGAVVEEIAESSVPALPRDVTGQPRFRPLEEEIRELERSRIEAALVATSGNQTRAAELIAMPLRTFQAKVKQYNLRSGRR